MRNDRIKKTINVYNKIAKKYSEVFDIDFSDSSYLDEFLSYIHTGKRILDLGCGTGRITAYYGGKGFDVVGVDLSREMLDIARKKYPKIDFRLDDIRKINFLENKFDAISFSYSFFHLEEKDVLSVLDKINKILKSNGVLFLVLQEGKGEVMVEEPFLPKEKIFLNLYTKDKITELLENNDFKIASIKRKKSSQEGELNYNKLFVIAIKK